MIDIKSPLLLNPNDFMMGDPIMDAQHIELIGSINELYQARFISNHTEINVILSNLINNTKEHFYLEEEELFLIGYPDIVKHVEEHRVLMDVGNHFLTRFNDEEDIAEELQKFLLNWLTSHILYSDRKVVKFCDSLH